MSDTGANFGLRLQAILRRVQGARRDVGADADIDLADLKDEVESVCEQLRAAPLVLDREAAAGDIEMILREFAALERELTEQHAKRLAGQSTGNGDRG